VERWGTPDDDEVEIRRLDPPPGAASDVPRLLILHGLEGTIQSHYLRGMLAQAHRRGWGADVLIFRSCNGEVNRAPRMYHSGETTDLDLVFRRLVREHVASPFVAVGFSLGGNVLLKWLGEQGADVPRQLRAAAAVSVPFDLERGARYLERGFARVYGRHFLRSLREKARAKLRAHPGLFDGAALERAGSIFQFDDAVTAPVHGFAGASDYYSRSSALGFLSRIRLPTMLLSAYDDPFLPRDVLETALSVAGRNQYVTTEFHERGGHVGFVSGRNPFRPRYFAEERTSAFLAAAIASPSTSPSSTPVAAGRSTVGGRSTSSGLRHTP
jgi:predicted alpha/beta-fold hydrolase